MTKALQEHVKAAIAPYKYPRTIRYVAALPRTETGKVQRFKLRAMAQEGAPRDVVARGEDRTVRALRPAGIVFYPRFFELMQEATEDFFRYAIGMPFEDLVNRDGIVMPIVSLDVAWHAPSRLADVLAIDVAVARLGARRSTSPTR
jgi:hypothetical protein